MTTLTGLFPLREPRGRPDELYRNWCEHLRVNEWADGRKEKR
jgi:hypothetical protein